MPLCPQYIRKRLYLTLPLNEVTLHISCMLKGPTRPAAKETWKHRNLEELGVASVTARWGQLIAFLEMQLQYVETKSVFSFKQSKKIIFDDRVCLFLPC